jgi:hypothetical protein
MLQSPQVWSQTLNVMAGLAPAIHAVPMPSTYQIGKMRHGVDGRDKPGHDASIF